MPSVPVLDAKKHFPTVDPYSQSYRHIGNALTSLGDFLARKDEEERIRATRQLDTEYGLALQMQQYGLDGTGGFNALQGQAAVDAFPQLLRENEEIRREIMSKYGKDFDEGMFDAAANKRDESFRAGAFQKVAAAKQQADQNLSVQRVALATNAAIADPRMIDDGLKQIRAEIYFAGSQSGQTADSPGVQLSLMNATGKYMRTVMGKALDEGDMKLALSLLDRMEPGGDATVDPGTYSALTKAFQGKQVDMEANALVEHALFTYGDDHAAARAFIKKEAGGAVEDEALDKHMKEIRDTNIIDNIAQSKYKAAVDRQKEAVDRAQKDFAYGVMGGIAEGELNSWDDLVKTFGIEIFQLDPKFQKQLTTTLSNFSKGLSSATEEGMITYQQAMTDPVFLDQLTPERIFALGTIMTQSMIKDLIKTKQEYAEDGVSGARRSFDKQFQAMAASKGLSGSEFAAVKGQVALQAYGDMRDGEVQWTNTAESDKILQKAFSAANLNDILGKNVSSIEASTSVRTRVNDLTVSLGIEDEKEAANFSLMFTEGVDKMFKGKPTAADLDNLSKMMTGDKFMIDGWLYGKNEKPVFEIFNDMSTEDRSHSRNELITAGIPSPTRIQIAINHSQNLASTYSSLTRADITAAVKSLKDKGATNILSTDVAIEHLRVK